ncbi:MAG: type II secretion system F family protein [Natronomonas sp.]
MTADEPVDRRPNVVEYRQYLPEDPPDGHDAETFDESYGRVRGYFKRRQDTFGGYQRWLGRARIGTTYDVYLSRTVTHAAIAAIAGFVVVLVFVAFRNLANVGGSFGTGVGVSFALLGGLLSATGVAVGYLGYPLLVSRRRGRRIDLVVPHVIVYLRAINQGSGNPTGVIRELSKLERVYGEAALEFATIRKDIDLYNDRLLTAIENAEQLTPSNALEEFFDDLVSVLESGGDLESFLDQKATEQFQRTKAELEELQDALVTLAEAYVSLVFVGPLLLLVVLIVLGITGSGVVDYLYLLTYLGIPLGILASMAVVHLLSSPYQIQTGATIEPDESAAHPPESSEPWFEEYLEEIGRRRLRRRVRDPLATFSRTPLYTVGVTVPVAIVVVGVAVVAGVLNPALETYAAEPIRFTTGFVVVPVLVVTVPLMAFHERGRKRRHAIQERFPDVLFTLASSNERGMSFVEGVELVSRRYDDPIGKEFRTLHRDVELDGDTTGALSALANRLRNPRLTMTISVIRELIAATDDLSNPLRSLANDLENRLSIQRSRRTEMSTYAIVVILGIFLYLLLVVVLDSFFIPQLTEVPAQDTRLFGSEPPVQIYRTIFFHSALIQAFGNGLLVGLLTDDSMYSGLKYSNALVGIVLLVFFLAP